MVAMVGCFLILHLKPEILFLKSCLKKRNNCFKGKTSLDKLVIRNTSEFIISEYLPNKSLPDIVQFLIFKVSIVLVQ